MSFKTKGYNIQKNIIGKEITDFLYSYLQLKHKVFNTLCDMNLISPYNTDWGAKRDGFVSDTFTLYADTTFDNLITFLKKKVEKETKLKLIESYSYVRLYKKGDELHKHTDRNGCTVSLTLNLGGDKWPIFLIDKKGIETDITLSPGDAILYQGRDLPHWRKKFKGIICGQVFLHYTLPDAKILYDTRKHIGLPNSASLRGEKN
tara:strand:- start:682 stop:1293 length:612 start_codon:yes stop_codon:yes gene_type:complete